MSNTAEPVGFSDLTEDEGFLIVLFRDWQRIGPTRAVAEHQIARALQRDRVYPALPTVFCAFRDVGQTNDIMESKSDTGVLLSPVEETLLTRLAASLGRQNRRGASAADVAVRPASEIVRSGHDRLLGECHRAYWQMAVLQALGSRRLN